MGTEDAAVIAALFSHLHDKEQIPSLLNAFQELRQGRCRNIRKVDVANIYFMTLPDGPHATERDAALRARHAEGKDVLTPDSDDAGLTDHWSDLRMVFGYDAVAEADNWWVQWGLLRERAQRPDIRGLGDMAFGHHVLLKREFEVVHSE